MRIKKYENWKFNNSNLGSLFNVSKSKTADIFSLSQLLQTPKKTPFHQDEHSQSIFTDIRMNNNYFDLNHKVLTKRQIQINQLVKANKRPSRDQSIKNKIKERIKEEYLNQSFIKTSPKINLKKHTNQNNNINLQRYIRTNYRQNKVYIKGNSVPIGSLQNQIRSKSSVLKRNTTSSSSKDINQHKDYKIVPQKTKTFRNKFYSVQIKIKNVTTQNSINSHTFSLKKRNSLIEIQPWQFQQGTFAFQN